VSELISLIADVGGSLGLALFAIWMLQRSYREQSEASETERTRLVNALDRNTEAWEKATEMMVQISTGMAIIADAANANRRDLTDIRVLLAKRPCINSYSQSETKRSRRRLEERE